MLVKNIDATSPLRIKVGEVEVYIMKIGEKAKLGVKAPKDMVIEIGPDESLPSSRK